MKKIVSEQLKRLGVPSNILGYGYLREAILLVADDITWLRSVTKKLYPEVAKICETTAPKVERAMRHAIHVAAARGNEQEWAEVMIYRRSCMSKPTNSEFIASVADYISLNEDGVHA